MADELTSYTDLADVVEQLPLLVREHRRRTRMSLREAGRQLGCSASTLSRLESGEHGVDTALVVRLLRWLGEPAAARHAAGRP